MQFLWTLWKKTHTKKIRVAYFSYRTVQKEEIVLSYRGENYRLICFRTWRDGNIMRKNKKHSSVSSYRLGKAQIEVEKFSARTGYSFSGFKFVEIDLKIIQELCRSLILYFKNCGIDDPKLFRSVIEENESKNS